MRGSTAFEMQRKEGPLPVDDSFSETFFSTLSRGWRVEAPTGTTERAAEPPLTRDQALAALKDLGLRRAGHRSNFWRLPDGLGALEIPLRGPIRLYRSAPSSLHAGKIDRLQVDKPDMPDEQILKVSRQGHPDIRVHIYRGTNTVGLDASEASPPSGKSIPEQLVDARFKREGNGFRVPGSGRQDVAVATMGEDQVQAIFQADERTSGMALVGAKVERRDKELSCTLRFRNPDSRLLDQTMELRFVRPLATSSALKTGKAPWMVHTASTTRVDYPVAVSRAIDLAAPWVQGAFAVSDRATNGYLSYFVSKLPSFAYSLSWGQ